MIKENAHVPSSGSAHINRDNVYLSKLERLSKLVRFCGEKP